MELRNLRAYARAVWQPTNGQWWTLLIVALLIVAAWPPADDRSLAIKFVNWAVDPRDRLPMLPDPYGPGEGDDLEAVNAHDLADSMHVRRAVRQRRVDADAAGTEGQTDPNPTPRRNASCSWHSASSRRFWSGGLLGRRRPAAALNRDLDGPRRAVALIDQVSDSQWIRAQATVLPCSGWSAPTESLPSYRTCKSSRCRRPLNRYAFGTGECNATMVRRRR